MVVGGVGVGRAGRDVVVTVIDGLGRVVVGRAMVVVDLATGIDVVGVEPRVVEVGRATGTGRGARVVVGVRPPGAACRPSDS